MKLTKQRKVYAAFLGLAAVAFIADRLVFLPAGAGAAPITEIASEKLQADSPSPARVEPADEGPSLSQRLQTAVAKPGSTRDPFRRTWTEREAQAPAAPGIQAPESASDFARTHPLKAVLLPRIGDPVAFIGDRAYAVGDEVGGWMLTQIEERAVTLTRGAASLVLELKTPGKGDNAGITQR